MTEPTATHDDPLLHGVVAATWEEIHTAVFPTEIFTYDSPSDATGTLKRPADVLGMRIQIWCCPRRHSLFGDPRIYHVSEYGTLPTAWTTVVTTAINLAIAMLGIGCRWRGLAARHRRSV